MREDFTVFDILKRAKELSPEVEISYGDSKQTYRQTYERVLGLSNSLLSMGITKGTVVGVADWNTPKFVELLYAAAAIGAVVYPVNIRLPPEQIVRTIKYSGVQWLFLSKDFVALSKNFDSEERIVALDFEDARWRYDDLIINRTSTELEVKVS